MVILCTKMLCSSYELSATLQMREVMHRKWLVHPRAHLLSGGDRGASQGSLYLYPELMNHPAVCPPTWKKKWDVSAIMSFPADLDVNGEGQNLSPPNKPLWHKNYFRLIIFRNGWHRQSSKNLSEKLPFYERHLNLWEKSPFVEVSPSVPGRGWLEFLETLVNGEYEDLNLRNNLNFVYFVYPVNLL